MTDKNYARVVDRLDTYAGAYGRLREAVRMFLAGQVSQDFLAAQAEKADKALAQRGGDS